MLLRTKSIDALIAASEEPGKRLAKTLGPWSLTALGIGAVIGSGIFILTGTAAAGEKLSYNSILHAPVLDLLLHGSAAVSTIGSGVFGGSVGSLFGFHERLAPPAQPVALSRDVKPLVSASATPSSARAQPAIPDTIHVSSVPRH